MISHIQLRPRTVFRSKNAFNIPLRPCDEHSFSADIKVVELNVRSLLNKSFIINDIILDHNLDIIILTETWLGTDAPVVLTEASQPNLIFLFSTRGC